VVPRSFALIRRETFFVRFVAVSAQWDEQKNKRKQLQRVAELTGNCDQGRSGEASRPVFVTGGFRQALRTQFHRLLIIVLSVPLHCSGIEDKKESNCKHY